MEKAAQPGLAAFVVPGTDNAMKVALLLSSCLLAPVAHAQQASFETRALTPETAATAARAALEACRKSGYQVGVAVVDRAGVLQVFLRDRFAGAHTVRVAIDKAWSAASFRIPTSELAKQTQPGQSMNGLRNVPRVTAIGGGLPIQAGGTVFGAIGVSGAPGGEADEACANAGLRAIADALEFEAR
jgi:uncharacterized protein GlcG (DUF336 family)